MHASVAHHYFSGGWYPRGGTSTLAKEIIPVIERSGGRVLVNAKVDKIILSSDGRTAVGVKMVKGDEIYADKVVSAAGVMATSHHLLPECSYRTKLLNKIKEIGGESCTFVYLFLKIDGTPTELGLRSSNIWSWPVEDYDKMLRDFYEDPENAPVPMFAGFPCAKDSTWEERFPGVSNAVILTAATFDMFSEWESCTHKRRGDEYNAKKDIFRKRMVDEICKYYPQLKGKILYADVGSPLTFNHYIGSTYGECYGLNCSSERFTADDWLRPQTDIKNLYLSGQDVTTLGFTGAMMGGVLAAHEVLGYGTLLDIITGRNLITDILKHSPEAEV
jgi:all-trans-retinol 13,14-reductase